MPILATCSPSEELGSWPFELSGVCFFGAITLGLMALIGGLMQRDESVFWRVVAVLAGLLALFPVGFAAYVHHIDFVAETRDGTEASGPLWKELVLPSMPILLAVVAFVTAGRLATPCRVEAA